MKTEGQDKIMMDKIGEAPPVILSSMILSPFPA